MRGSKPINFSCTRNLSQRLTPAGHATSREEITNCHTPRSTVLEKTYVHLYRCKTRHFPLRGDVDLETCSVSKNLSGCCSITQMFWVFRFLKQNMSLIYFAVLWSIQHWDDPDPWESVYKVEWEESRAELYVHIDGSSESLFTGKNGGEGLLGDICWNWICVEGLGMWYVMQLF